MLIDDDQDDLTLLREVMNSIGKTFKIIEANDGEAGLRTIRSLNEGKETPCLIVVDLNMPKMDGRQTFTELKKINALCNTPIIIFSTAANPTERHFFEENGAAYVVKPIRFNHLFNIATKMISSCLSAVGKSPCE